MKHMLKIAALAFVSASAQAKTVCTISATAPNQADRQIFSAPFEKQMMLLVAKDRQSVQPFVFEEKSQEQWQAINGQTVVTFVTADNNQMAISVSHIDMSLGDNMLPMDTLATGPISVNFPLALIAPSRSLSAECYGMP